MQVSRKLRYGYRLEGGKAVPDEAEQTIIKRIVNDYALMGARKTAAGLNEDGVPTKRAGSKWSHTTVAKIVRDNPHIKPDAVAVPSTSPERKRASLPPIPNTPVDPADHPSGFIEWDEIKVDFETGEIETAWTDQISVAEWNREAEAFRAVQEAEGRRPFRFVDHAAFRPPFDLMKPPVSKLVEALTRRHMYDLKELIGQIKDDSPRVQAFLKRKLSLLWGTVLTELAIQREANLALRQELVDAHKTIAEVQSPTPQPATAVEPKEHRPVDLSEIRATDLRMRPDLVKPRRAAK
jgi:hypothetical protein